MSDSEPDKKQQEINYYKKQLKELTSSLLGLQYQYTEMSREVQQMRKGFALIANLQNVPNDENSLENIFDRFTEEISVRLQMDLSFILLPAPDNNNQYIPDYIKAYSTYDSNKLRDKRVALPVEFKGKQITLLVNSETQETSLINFLREEFSIRNFILTPIIYNNNTIAFIFAGRNTEGLQGAAKLLTHHQNAIEAIAGVVSAVKSQLDKNILLEQRVNERTQQLNDEMEKSERLLLNILPADVADELKKKGSSDARHYDAVTVLFTDFRNFTNVSEQMDAQELVNEINFCYSEFDRIISRHGIEKIKTIGDSYMCAGGLPVPKISHAEDTLKAALEIRDFMLKEKHKREAEGRKFFEIRIGLHSGPVVAGIVGIKKFAYDIWGDTVNIASRIESSGEAGKVNISENTYALIKDKFACIHRGKIPAKNKGEIDMYFVEK